MKAPLSSNMVPFASLDSSEDSGLKDITCFGTVVRRLCIECTLELASAIGRDP